MIRKTIASYGGPYVDGTVVVNPESENPSEFDNKALDDCAAMTNTAVRSWVEFLTNASTNPAAADTSHLSLWGSGTTGKPVVTRTAAGKYTITLPTTYVDGNSETQTVSIIYARVSVRIDNDTIYLSKVKTIAGNVVTILVTDVAGTPSDAAGAAYVLVEMV